MLLTRREVLKTALGGTLPIRASARSSSRPKPLLLMADQFRADCIGADGNAVIHTPNLDRIAREGALFRCACLSMPARTPARSALLTGLAPWNHGMPRTVRMADHYPLVKPKALRNAGYYTMGIGKMHYHSQRLSYGFQNLVLDESARVETPDFRSDYQAWGTG